MRLSVGSEYGALKRVLVHRPGAEIERITAQNRARMLFEQVPCLDRLVAEHDRFVATLRRESGAEVLYVEDLLLDVLRDPEPRRQLVRRVAEIEGCASLVEPLLDRCREARDMLRILIAGLTVGEARRRGLPTSTRSARGSLDAYLIGPLPNLYFMRDAAAVVGETVVSARMYYRARERESALVNFVLRHHPRLGSATRQFFEFAETTGERLTIEGGDVAVLNREAIAVGCSERTGSETIRELARRLFASGVVKRVYEVPLPARREYMHLDTVFTVVGPRVVVAHSLALRAIPRTRLHTVESDGETPRSFLDVLGDELPRCEIVETGNGEGEYAASEQLTDGTNVFAIAPNKVITYDQNPRTNRALRGAGVDVIDIDGSELVKGLGGPHCMTMPLEREMVA